MQSLHSVFEDEFLREYNAATPKVRRQVLPYLQALYRRWYYSTLVEGIQLSPANISDTIAFHCRVPDGTHTFPQPVPPVTKLSGLAIRHNRYSPYSHPVVADFHALIDYCRPHIDLSEDWILTDKQAMAISKKLSLPDPYYASFLFELASRMEIIVRAPSLYVQRMQVATSANATSILSQPSEDLFRHIVDTTIGLTSTGMQNVFPVTIPFFTEEGLRNLLSTPLTTDVILESAFNALGFDVTEAAFASMLASFDCLTDDYNDITEVVSGIYVMGIMLDRLFFTPFGHFLRIIRPFYATKMDIKNEFKRFEHAHHESFLHSEEITSTLHGFYSDDEFSALFAPCSTYTLTDIGIWFTKADATKENYLDCKRMLPKSVLDFAFSSKENVEIFINATGMSVPVSQLPNSIYSFRIKDLSEPTIWVTLQIPKMFSLHQLYVEIMDIFSILEGDYDFYRGTFVNPFAKYSGAWDFNKLNKRRAKSPDSNPVTVALAAMDFNHVRELLLVVTNRFGESQFLLEWLNETAPDQNMTYPDIVASSPAYKDMLEDFDFDLDDDFD